MDNFEELGKDLKPVKITTKKPIGSVLLTMDGDRCIYYADGTWEVVKTQPGLHWPALPGPFLRRVYMDPVDSKLQEIWDSLLDEDAPASEGDLDRTEEK